MGSSSDSEKVIQRLNDELQEAQELAKIEKHKCRELQGKRKSTQYLPDQYSVPEFYLVFNQEIIIMQFWLILSVTLTYICI